MRGLTDGNAAQCIRAAVALRGFHAATGLGRITLLEAGRDAAKRAGDVQGEADCILSLGFIAEMRSDHDGARQRYEEALPLYERIQEPFSIGRARLALAEVARRDAEERRHRQAARECWLSIGRNDLARLID